MQAADHFDPTCFFPAAKMRFDKHTASNIYVNHSVFTANVDWFIFTLSIYFTMEEKISAKALTSTAIFLLPNWRILLFKRREN